MLLPSWLRFFRPDSQRRPTKRHRGKRPPSCRLQVEALEDRCLLAAGLSAALVADIVPGVDSSAPVNLTNVNGTLFFAARNASGGGEVMKSDGTASGTVGLANIYGSNFTPMNRSVFFFADGLWKTDGTSAGTVLVKAVAPSVSEFGGVATVNGKLFFGGFDPKTGAELWVSDGTAAGTVLVKDIFRGTRWEWDCDRGRCTKVWYINNSNPSWLTDLNGTLVFAAYDENNGRELWKSDGTAKGTTLVKDIVPGSAGSNPQNLTVVNGVAYFGAAGGLWRSDGTNAGTFQLKTFANSPSELTDVNGTLFFNAGWELWRSDGTAAGTVLVIAYSVASDPQALAAVNGTLFFNAWASSSGRELWKSDGTPAGTVLVKDINAGAGGSNPGGLTHDENGLHTGGLTNVNGLVYFAAGDAADERGNPTNVELWQSDGTAAGTVMVQDIYPGSTGSDPAWLVAMNNKLYFAATDPVHGRELWDPPPVGSGGYLLVPDLDRHNVLRFDAKTGAFVDEFVSRMSGGLNQPFVALYGPHDHNLYVSTGHLHGPGQIKAVLRYDGATGAFLDEFVQGGQMDMPHAFIFGPDGNIYFGDRVDGNIGHPQGGRILRFDGRTGAFMDEFVPRLSGGLKHPVAFVFGPDDNGDGKLDLYVSDEGPSRILHYDGTTGAFLGEFVTSGSGGLTFPQQLSFAPDGNLYLGSFGTGSVMRFQGPTGKTPGAPMPSPGNSGADFVPAGSGGLLGPVGVIFGPDANGDGNQDIYVASILSNGVAHGKEGNIKRYDGITGSFIDTLVPNGRGGLDDPNLLSFTATDPVTLAYTGTTTTATAAALSAASASSATAAAHVNGGGQAMLTDGDGNVFSLSFGLPGVLNANGPAHGVINFVFGPAFSQLWGAVAGVDSIHLWGIVTTVTVGDDGTITLEGQVTEKDFSGGDGMVFVEENIPFTIVVSPDSSQFTLQWCELPTFDQEVIGGNLVIH